MPAAMAIMVVGSHMEVEVVKAPVRGGHDSESKGLDVPARGVVVLRDPVEHLPALRQVHHPGDPEVPQLDSCSGMSSDERGGQHPGNCKLPTDGDAKQRHHLAIRGELAV